MGFGVVRPNGRTHSENGDIILLETHSENGDIFALLG